jgi:hypothetical protein
MPKASRKAKAARRGGGSAARDRRKARAQRPAAPAPRRARKPQRLARPAKAASARPAPAPGAPAAKPKAGTAPAAKTAPGKPAEASAGAAGQARPQAKPQGKGQPSRKSSRRSALSQRRGPDGELLAPGELLLPNGPQSIEEVLYLLRGCVAAEHGDVEAGITEVIAKRPAPSDPAAVRAELARHGQAIAKRFANGAIEPLLPTRPPSPRRTFASVVERARMRRREIGAFLRGLHLGRTETSHMDSHGEASLQSLMEWAARLENLMEAEEPNQADYSQFHRGLDHLENTTEALIVDVEATLRRLRDRARSR